MSIPNREITAQTEIVLADGYRYGGVFRLIFYDSRKGMIATMKKRWGLRLCSLLLSLVLAVPLAGTVLAAGPSSQTEYAGIDVSEWQGDIDFAKVKADGISVVYIRASVGRYTDPYFQRNYQNAKANGLAVGFYHYLTARTVPQAREEAAYFASVVAKTKPDCHLVMDFEYFSGLSRAQINAIAQAFLEALEEATGRTAAIYTNANSAQNLFDTALAKYPLWVADWSREPQDLGPWENWAGFQYSDQGRVNGISGRVDLDRFTSDMFCDNASQEIPSAGGQTITYTVKRGDTLWGIARRFGTTVSQLAQRNGISNPNLIFPGMVLQISGSASAGESDIVTYTVKRGDTLWDIARRYDTTVAYLAGINRISNPSRIYPGEVLRVPRGSNSRGSSGSSSGSSGIAVRTYTVKRGDTLWGIAQRFGTTVSQLASRNGITNPSLIYPGMVLRISGSAPSESVQTVRYTVRRGDTLWGIAQRYHTTVSRLAQRNGISNPGLIYPGEILVID
ncbi:LysM peptidoglycan-binding domain-containing protein [Blautia sp.]|uniref:LysM peptidoglycan-binding domain-containing protein n=1 Tax=Blautia sp. TaxID=1955243 RepID=UPI0025BFB3D7|nr:LysM peptidoglycan-binding domain-containing protein [Blautia sp.]